MKKNKSIVAAALLLLITACNGEALQPDADSNNPQIAIGNLEVAGQTQLASTRADEDGLSTWYQGDVLRVEGVGNNTLPTPPWW